LDDIIAIRAGEEIRAGFAANETAVPVNEQSTRLLISSLCRADQR